MVVVLRIVRRPDATKGAIDLYLGHRTLLNRILSLAAPAALVALTASLSSGCAASTYPLNASMASGAPISLTAESATPPGRRPARAGATALVQEGACSWYGQRFHGRRTSNGETFDQTAFTAAHRTLPFGTQVEVTDLDTGKKVRVRINDRGPFSHQRVIDLSYAAAASLGMIGRGTARVSLQPVDDESVTWPETVYSLQVASFTSRPEAERFVTALTPSQKAAAVYFIKEPEPKARGYRVRFGPFDCEETARSVASELKRKGLASDLVAESLAGGSVVADNAPAHLHR